MGIGAKNALLLIDFAKWRGRRMDYPGERADSSRRDPLAADLMKTWRALPA